MEQACIVGLGFGFGPCSVDNLDGTSSDVSAGVYPTAIVEQMKKVL